MSKILSGEEVIKQLTIEERIEILEMQMNDVLAVVSAMNLQIGRLIVMIEANK